MIPTDSASGHMAACAFAMLAPRIWKGETFTDAELDEIRREAREFVGVGASPVDSGSPVDPRSSL